MQKNIYARYIDNSYYIVVIHKKKLKVNERDFDMLISICKQRNDNDDEMNKHDIYYL